MDESRVMERLQRERQQLLRQIEALNQNGLRLGARDSIQELSVVDNHPADVASETFERGKDLGIKDDLEILLKKNAQAMKRLEEGKYGICQRCGSRIDEERLEAMPSATLCMRCEREIEIKSEPQARPVEEEVVPPFGRSGIRDDARYDGVDAWEDVARYGSSYSPQDQPGSQGYQDLQYEEQPDSGVVQEVEGMIGQHGEAILRTRGYKRVQGKPSDRR